MAEMSSLKSCFQSSLIQCTKSFLEKGRNSCLEIHGLRACQAIVYRVTKIRYDWSDLALTLFDCSTFSYIKIHIQQFYVILKDSETDF